MVNEWSAKRGVYSHGEYLMIDEILTINKLLIFEMMIVVGRKMEGKWEEEWWIERWNFRKLFGCIFGIPWLIMGYGLSDGCDYYGLIKNTQGDAWLL